jgi:hypothetical protein
MKTHYHPSSGSSMRIKWRNVCIVRAGKKAKDRLRGINYSLSNVYVAAFDTKTVALKYCASTTKVAVHSHNGGSFMQCQESSHQSKM